MGRRPKRTTRSTQFIGTHACCLTLLAMCPIESFGQSDQGVGLVQDQTETRQINWNLIAANSFFGEVQSLGLATLGTAALIGLSYYSFALDKETRPLYRFSESFLAYSATFVTYFVLNGVLSEKPFRYM